MVSEYERQKQENIKKNKELLAQLGLDKPLFEPKAKKVQPSKKRKASQVEDGDEQPVLKLQRSDSDTPPATSSPTPENGLRRSARHQGKVVDYKKVQQDSLPTSAAYASGIKSYENEGPMGQGGKRKHNPKTFGHIPGVEVGTWWRSREDCSIDAIHAPWVAGISGGPQGAYSVALSGGYDDDVDVGYAFTYTGCGGRNLRGTKDKPKNLRTAPQSFDQTFDHSFNKSLLQSCKSKKPIRVIRGYNVRSKYAPYEGFRYDGLYTVEKAWQERGINSRGFLVCRFAFKRIPGQAPLPVRADWHDEAAKQEDKTDENSTGEN